MVINAKPQSLQGFDKNNNGVRDDVETYLDAKFKDSPNYKEALKQLAFAMQKGIVSKTQEESMIAAHYVFKAIDCIDYVDEKKTIESWKIVEKKMLNNSARVKAWDAQQIRTSGKPMPVYKEGKTSCNFKIIDSKNE